MSVLDESDRHEYVRPCLVIHDCWEAGLSLLCETGKASARARQQGRGRREEGGRTRTRP